MYVKTREPKRKSNAKVKLSTDQLGIMECLLTGRVINIFIMQGLHLYLQACKSINSIQLTPQVD